MRIQAPAVEGKANAALRKWAAEFFGVKAHDVDILRGEKTTTKTLLLKGMTLEAAAAKLGKSEE